MLYAFIGVALFVIGLACFRLIKYRSKTKKYYRVKGIVISNELNRTIAENATIQSQVYYSPVIKFTDNTGTEQIFTAAEDNPERPLYKPGKEVVLLVNKNDPSRFIFYDVVDGYIIPIIWILFGIAIMLLGIYCIQPQP